LAYLVWILTLLCFVRFAFLEHCSNNSCGFFVILHLFTVRFELSQQTFFIMGDVHGRKKVNLQQFFSIRCFLWFVCYHYLLFKTYYKINYFIRYNPINDPSSNFFKNRVIILALFLYLKRKKKSASTKLNLNAKVVRGLKSF
jgi:hypothetical protein